jgi:hypothetical protein
MVMGCSPDLVTVRLMNNTQYWYTVSLSPLDKGERMCYNVV